MTVKALVIGVVLVRALVIGVVLVLAALFTPAHADEGNGRYTIVPMPGHGVLVLAGHQDGAKLGFPTNAPGLWHQPSAFGLVARGFFRTIFPANDLPATNADQRKLTP